MKKKILFFGAALAAVATFTSCSNDEDLVQAPEPQPVEEPAVVKGTPFGVSASAAGATRAIRYNANAWDGSNSETWVSCFKLYGKQDGATDPWMNDVIFTRTAYNAAWLPTRDKTQNISEVTWPVDDTSTEADETDVVTNFYAVTDGAIKSAANGNGLEGVTSWMNPVGAFTYTQTPTTDAKIAWYFTSAYIEADPADYPEVSWVDPAKMTDLMVAEEETKESETTNGTINLHFSHILAGLTIKVKFLSDSESQSGVTATIRGVMVTGLNTSGTYTIGTGWSNLSTPTIYYKSFSDPIVIAAQPENTTEGSQTIETLVAPGEWMVIPQTVTPWNRAVQDNAENANGAYISIQLLDSATKDELVLSYPIDTTALLAGKNRVLTFDLGQFLDMFADSNENGIADNQYEPTIVIGA